MTQTRVLADQPISDAYMFNFSTYASLLASKIASKSVQTPLVIGVNGQWGSGKTSLLRTTKALLDDSRPTEKQCRMYTFLATRTQPDISGNFRAVKTIWFNAWKYADSKDILAALILRIVQGMKRDNLWQRLKAQWAELSQKEWGPFVAKLLDADIELEAGISAGLVSTATIKWGTGAALEEFFKGSRAHQAVPFYEDFQVYFNKLIQMWAGHDPDQPERGGVLAVFIDDLDRCPPSKVASVLEAINLFLDTRGCVFVMAADLGAVASAVEMHYGDKIANFDGRGYLEKIFQWSFQLPPLLPEAVEQFVIELLAGSRYKVDQIAAIAKGLDPNPRKIKRYINAVTSWVDLLEALPDTAAKLDADQISRERFLALAAEYAAINLYFGEFDKRVRENPNLLLAAHLVTQPPASQATEGKLAQTWSDISDDLMNTAASLVSDHKLRDLLLAFPIHEVGWPKVKEINLIISLNFQ